MCRILLITENAQLRQRVAEKKDDNLNKKNFRPVSVLTGITKLYESVVNDQLFEFFCTLFNDLISAYRKGYCCQSLLLKCVDN